MLLLFAGEVLKFTYTVWNNIQIFTAEICYWLICEGHGGPRLTLQQQHPRNKALHLHLSERRTGSPTSTKLSPELISRQLKVVWECNLQMDSATEAHIPLWGDKKEIGKQRLQTNCNHHKSCFSLFNCNNNIRWLIMRFLTTSETLITPAWRTAWIVGSDMQTNYIRF